MEVVNLGVYFYRLLLSRRITQRWVVSDLNSVGAGFPGVLFWRLRIGELTLGYLVMIDSVHDSC